LHTADNLLQALRSGWRMLLDSWSVWLLLAVVSLFFTGLEQRLLHPALAQILPRIPPPDTTVVPSESYVVLLMEGTHQMYTSEAVHRLGAALGLVVLLKWLLQPFLGIFVFSPLSQPAPTVSYYLLWRQLAHRFPAFCAVAVIQGVCVGTTVAGAGILGSYLAEDIVWAGQISSLVLLLLSLLAAGALFSWGFSAFTLWQAALAQGERLWSGATRALKTTFRRRPVLCMALPMAFWLLSTSLAATLQMFSPTAKWSILLACAWLPLPFLWLTYTLVAACSEKQP